MASLKWVKGIRGNDDRPTTCGRYVVILCGYGDRHSGKDWGVYYVPNRGRDDSHVDLVGEAKRILKDNGAFMPPVDLRHDVLWLAETCGSVAEAKQAAATHAANREYDDEGWPNLTNEQFLAHCYRITQNALAEDIELSVRAVYYGLVGSGIIKPDAKEGEGTRADQRRNYRRVSEVIVQAKESGDFPLEWLRDELRIPKTGETTTCDLDPRVGVETARRWLGTIPTHVIEVDRWYGQPVVPLVVIEKDALYGTIKRAIETHKVPIFTLRGYPSWTGVYSWFAQLQELWEELSCWDDPPEVRVLYMGDHDPDGMFIPEAMQNILESMAALKGAYTVPPDITWERVALTQEQALAHGAPSMGVKESSSRAPRYIEMYGYDAWEVEALPPVTLRTMLEEALADLFDESIYRANQALARDRRRQLIDKLKDPAFISTIDWQV